MPRDLTFFYMEGCPYCRNAEKAVRELQKENVGYAAVPVRWIDENREPVLAASYDYYRVPSIFDGKKKLYEASPAHDCGYIRGQVERAFRAVMNGDQE